MVDHLHGGSTNWSFMDIARRGGDGHRAAGGGGSRGLQIRYSSGMARVAAPERCDRTTIGQRMKLRYRHVLHKALSLLDVPLCDIHCPVDIDRYRKADSNPDSLTP